jgi:mitogen-activated protein kinase kinase 2
MLKLKKLVFKSSSSPKGEEEKVIPAFQKRLTLDLKSPEDRDDDFEGAILSLDNEFREKIRVSCSMPRCAKEFVQIGNLIGKGNSGSVFKAVNLEDYKVYALKRIYAGGSKKSANRSQLLKEVQTFSALQSPYLVGHYGTIVPTRGTEEDDDHITFVLEYMNRGSLQNVIDNYGAVEDEKTIQLVSKMVLLGLDDMHKNNHIHRDMKPGNIVLSHKGQVKITDFGIARALSRKDAQTFVGTHIYMSPERIEQKQYSFAADIWGFGLSILTLATGKFPFEGVGTGGFAYLFYALTQCPAPTLPQGKFSKEFSDFITRCLQHDPSKRWSAQQLLNHPFLRNVDICAPKDGSFKWPWENQAGEIDEKRMIDLKDAVDVVAQLCHISPGSKKQSTQSRIIAQSLSDTLGISFKIALQTLEEELISYLPVGRDRSAAVCE